MDDAEVEAEIARIEREEAEADRQWGVLVCAIEGGVLGERYAGRWGDRDGRFFVGVKGDATQAEGALAAACPGVTVHVVGVEHSLAELERLRARILRRGDDVGAPLSAIVVDVIANRVRVMLVDFDDAGSKALRDEFASAPVVWIEDEVLPAR